MPNVKVLVVDDEMRMRKLIKDFLIKDGFEVLEADNGLNALEIFNNNRDIGLILLDVMMPVMNGYEVCEKIRAFSDVPIIMLTAKSQEADELLGFKLGVDEYITKPFSPKILVARCQAVLRRGNNISNECDLLEKGGISLDKTTHIVRIDGVITEFSYKEFELLAFFLENEGVALSREKILSNVWNYDYFGDARTIDTHVKKIRAKLGDKGDYIKTIWGMGYKFEAFD